MKKMAMPVANRSSGNAIPESLLLELTLIFSAPNELVQSNVTDIGYYVTGTHAIIASKLPFFS